MDYKNKERRSANISLFLMLIGILATVIPFLLNVDMMSWGFAVAFLGLLLTVIAFFVFLMFNGRAKVLDKMFESENILAHWQYSKEFWDQISAEDMKDSGLGKVFGFFIGGIFVLIGIIIFILDTEENGLFLLIMLGVAVFFVIIGFVSSSAEKRRVKASTPEAIISQEGLFFKNILYTWNSKAVSYLESVTMDPVQPSTILFVLRQLSGGGINRVHYHPFYLSIPIPPEQQQSALAIIQYFNLPMDQEKWDSMQQRGNEEEQ